ncbi:5,10-methenyltetrahydrofolate synthetase (5-formyltetrahydrofolate cyclo-ligase) isoform X1 [Latimeria chalumnae]|uniref:5-formyltetrahydrofolate cyclo-ligase n=1 Tax=Latimeria chalumnae TaxID=7897 RepID=H3ABJ5_LATCH|nr:PREDICTED: 5-formyltetrahydrofolate cyclo-ligase isoform X1 [Latimeria chalumnae]|eukprot:XP_005989638.1 PREDICTED: 5-formyltetrahydrofolate cyclo-ligase isoform X1 [Latimeria chalumnae]
METGGERPKPSNPDSMAALRAAKKALRAEIKSRISALSPQEKLRQSAIVTQKLITHTRYQSCQRIAVFLSMSDEVQTEEIIKNIFQCGKECFIPRYKKKSNHMDMIKLSVMEEICSLPLTSWNIQQPADDDPREDALATGGIDLILMPGLGFDKSGNRLGRGKGYYDTYLTRCLQHPKAKPYMIALAFKEQICNSVPVGENDIKIDEILYEGE